MHHRHDSRHPGHLHREEFARSRGPRYGRGRGGPRARRGDVRAAVLALLAERPMHGYEMIKEIEERTDGAWTPSAGSIYPTLQMLEDEGLIRGEESDGKRRFTLTEDGRRPAGREGRRADPVGRRQGRRRPGADPPGRIDEEAQSRDRPDLPCRRPGPAEAGPRAARRDPAQDLRDPRGGELTGQRSPLRSSASGRASRPEPLRAAGREKPVPPNGPTRIEIRISPPYGDSQKRLEVMLRSPSPERLAQAIRLRRLNQSSIFISPASAARTASRRVLGPPRTGR